MSKANKKTIITIALVIIIAAFGILLIYLYTKEDEDDFKPNQNQTNNKNQTDNIENNIDKANHDQKNKNQQENRENNVNSGNSNELNQQENKKNNTNYEHLNKQNNNREEQNFEKDLKNMLDILNKEESFESSLSYNFFVKEIVIRIMLNLDTRLFSNAVPNGFIDCKKHLDTKKTCPYIMVENFLQKMTYYCLNQLISDLKNILDAKIEIVYKGNTKQAKTYIEKVFQNWISTNCLSDDIENILRLLMSNINKKLYSDISQEDIDKYYINREKEKTLPYIMIDDFLQRISLFDLRILIELLQQRLLCKQITNTQVNDHKMVET